MHDAHDRILPTIERGQEGPSRQSIMQNAAWVHLRPVLAADADRMVALILVHHVHRGVVLGGSLSTGRSLNRPTCACISTHGAFSNDSPWQQDRRLPIGREG
jgi:hypothetical protein